MLGEGGPWDRVNLVDSILHLYIPQTLFWRVVLRTEDRLVLWDMVRGAPGTLPQIPRYIAGHDYDADGLQDQFWAIVGVEQGERGGEFEPPLASRPP